MRVLLQFPEGLKQYALSYADRLEREGEEVFISASPTYGACDLAIDEAKSIRADKLIHFGHNEFNKVDFNVEFVEYRIDAPLEILDESLEHLKGFHRIGIVTTVQHLHQLKDVSDFYTSRGFDVVIGKPFGFAKARGQILGCDVGSAARIDREVDAFVYFGGGRFHPIGAVMNTTKPFLLIEPFEKLVEFIDSYRERYRRASKGKVLSSLNAKSAGILVSTKNGQFNMNVAQLLKKKAEAAGMSAQILVSNTFDFEAINNMMGFDIFVNTACPRIAIDDVDRTIKPILSPNELIDMLRMRAELSQTQLSKQ
ncbi:MAG: diphthamide biosynthesis enzyme Dph2 [Candidatus Marsarchaeota archaeon]|jgi:2-(3-amino-3-carboxypropyl)histidine synthase|nr:diphthamide biosynthesis enzyme Dph2 [Candidatus Marsarchaeota archaeon]